MEKVIPKAEEGAGVWEGSTSHAAEGRGKLTEQSQPQLTNSFLNKARSRNPRTHPCVIQVGVSW